MPETKKQLDKKTDTLADIVLEHPDDRVKRWKAVHDLLRHTNKKARKEQDKIAKECASVRQDKIFKKEKSKIMGLRFGVSMPPTTWTALVQADELIFGHSELHHPHKEDSSDLRATNQIVKDLEKAFPQYKVS